jgi:hypothetical protein
LDDDSHHTWGSGRHADGLVLGLILIRPLGRLSSE